MKSWILLASLLFVASYATDISDSIVADSSESLGVVTAPVTTEAVVLDSAQAAEILANIEEDAAKLSFYVDIQKNLKTPLSEKDIQAKFKEHGIDVPLTAISLEKPITEPSKKKAKKKDLEKIHVDLGNNVETDVYVEIKEDKVVDKWGMLFNIIGGLAIFLLGMNYMSNGLQTIAGPRLRSMIAAVTNNRFMAVFAGAGVTTLVQSSSVTTVMVVGFVNSGIMTLRQSLGVIFGANIGTTITGWIIALKVGKYGLPVLGIAAIFYLFSRKDRMKYIAMTVMGVGMVFFGLELMKHGFEPIKYIPAFETMFSSFKVVELTYFNINMYKAMFIGTLLTLLVQSSSATLGITITLAATGVINFYTAAALVMGQNIGTTITALIAALNTNRTARQAAMGHMFFNVFGVLWVTTLFPVYIHIIEGFFELFTAHQWFGLGQSGNEPIEAELALVHTLFNVVNVLLFLPFIDQLARFLEKILPSNKDEGTLHVTSLHAGTLFESPNLAIEAAKFEIAQMGKLVVEIDGKMQAVLRTKREDLTEEMKQEIFDLEEKLDIYQKEISEFLMECSATKSTSHAEAERIQMLFRHADEYESISDYYVKVLRKGIRLIESDIKLPADEKKALLAINEKLGLYIGRVDSAVNENDGTQGPALEAEYAEVRAFIKGIKKQHLTRLQNEEMSPMLSVTYLDMISGFRQINGHLLNMSELL